MRPSNQPNLAPDPNPAVSRQTTRRRDVGTPRGVRNLIEVAGYFLAVLITLSAHAASVPQNKPPQVKVIFDTDIGNDVDDVLALSMLHALQSRADCELLAV